MLVTCNNIFTDQLQNSTGTDIFAIGNCHESCKNMLHLLSWIQPPCSKALQTGSTDYEGKDCASEEHPRLFVDAGEAKEVSTPMKI